MILINANKFVPSTWAWDDDIYRAIMKIDEDSYPFHLIERRNIIVSLAFPFIAEAGFFNCKNVVVGRD